MRMAIFLPERTATAVHSLTPREIVAELDKFVIGQGKAKRAVAIALRNRMRRQQLPPDIAEEVTPKNILMIGPTGVGKTEIARRLARLAQSPFIKVEASKFTEVGYVGRDVESMVRDLVELAVDMVREEKAEEVQEKAKAAAMRRATTPRSTTIRLRRPTINSLSTADTGTPTRRLISAACLALLAMPSWIITRASCQLGCSLRRMSCTLASIRMRRPRSIMPAIGWCNGDGASSRTV